MQDQGEAGALKIQVEMCHIARGKDHRIPSSETEQKPWLEHAKFSTRPFPKGYNSTEQLVPAVPVSHGRHPNVEHIATKRMSGAALVQWEMGSKHLDSGIFTRKKFCQLNR